MKAISNRIRFVGVAALVIGACNGQLVIEDEPEEEPWTGNGPNCPATVPGDLPCDTEGEICAYQYPDTINQGHTTTQSCACWETSATEKSFYCYQSSGSIGECPEQEPSDEDSCFGSFGTECIYPERTRCSCSAATEAWSCEEEEGPDVTPPPESIPTDTPINAMSDSERAAWCGWFATAYNGPGFPEEAPSPVNDEGYTTNTGCRGSGSSAPTCSAFIPGLDRTGCEGNLALSTCDAPIAELTDCVLTVFDLCWPAPHGCARYLSRPGCDRTIAVDARVPVGSTGGTGGSGAGGTFSTGGTTTGSGNTGPTQTLCSVRVR